MEAQARLRYYNGQNQGKEYWVLKKVAIALEWARARRKKKKNWTSFQK